MRTGFFPASSLISTKQELGTMPKCGPCGLLDKCHSPKMPVNGKGRRKILIIGEAQGATENERGIPFCGKAGHFLEESLHNHNINMRRDCWIMNSISCWPGKGNPAPSDNQINYCRPLVFNAIKELKPEVILLLGKSAVKSVIGNLWKEDPGEMGRWCGWQIPSQELNAWVLPTYHPSYLMRENNPVLDLWFNRHIEAINQLEGRPWVNVPDYKSQIEIILDSDEAASIIRERLNYKGLVAWDLECNMLKPDRSKAQIISCAICWGKKTIAFPWMGEVIEAMKEFVRSDCPKIAANLKYEDRWIRSKLGCAVKNWSFDCMQASHVLDCRRGITSLKFQSFVQLGMPSYNDHIEPYFHSKGTNEPNRIKEIDIQSLLLYNGLDALLEYLLSKIQMEEIGI